jgi:hypothetical protein
MNVWYFAYGSNVKLAQMKERVGEFKLSRRAVLRNYKLADIQLAKLQTFEGVPPLEISVELEDESEIKNVKTFLWNTTEQEHKPPEVYRRIIEQGLTEHGYENATVRKNFDKFRR